MSTFNRPTHGLASLAQRETDKAESYKGSASEAYDQEFIFAEYDPCQNNEFNFHGLLQLATNMADAQERLYVKAQRKKELRLRKNYTHYNDPVTTT